MTNFGKLLVLSAVLVGIAYYFFAPHGSREPGRGEAAKDMIWEQLSSCSPMQSLDGKRVATFQDDHSLQITDETLVGKTEYSTSGTWNYDESTKKYVIKTGDEQRSYSLIQVQDSEVCLLAFGNVGGADLSQSWYSQTLEDLRGAADEYDR